MKRGAKSTPEPAAPTGSVLTAAEGVDGIYVPPIREWDIEDLRDAEYNPREITDRQLADLQASIEDFGLVEDVVVNTHPDRYGVVVGGHQKLKILRAKGVTRVPCKEVRLEEERERELNVRLNANGGQFSAQLLLSGGFRREDLDDWGLSREDLADFDRAASAAGAEMAAQAGVVEDPSWDGMPEFEHEDLEPWKQMKVSFRSPEDREAFARLVDQTFTDKTRSIWYPKAVIEPTAHMRYLTDDPINPRYPVYVISKGRWESRLTVKSLERNGIPYRVVVEPQEYNHYAAVIAPEKILVLPFSNLGLGSIPARNWVWDHAVAAGAERHWILDDNIRGFWRFQNNFKYRVATGATFRACEDFSDRFSNVGISGMNYYMFVTRKSGRIRPYTLNTRIYSCILIKNDIPYRWRGRYNEDTDLSLRALKDGYCTILFNAFLAWKMTTMEMKGGNTDELYKDRELGRLKMAESLREQHPDVVTVVRKWNRWQHQVDYRPFRENKLILKPGVEVPEGVNNYGMWLHVDSPKDQVDEREYPEPSEEEREEESDEDLVGEEGDPA